MIKTQKVYEPMYTDKEHFIILITGGRGSGKSFNAATFIERLTFEKTEEGIAHKVLYSRYTMTSASISVIPEVLEKIEADGTEKFFACRKQDIENLITGGRIMFRGINTSSGNQTAKLKSIHGLTTFVVDEGEEWTSETDFEKIILSIRQKGIKCRVVIIMNPTDTSHFVYRKYIKDTHKEVMFGGVPVQISTHPNVLHIHTTYLDNLDNLGDEFINEIEEMKRERPERYAHVVMGRWDDISEGAVFKNWGIVECMPDDCIKISRAMDFGYSADPTAIVRCGIKDNTLFIDELCYRTRMTSGDIIRELKQEEDFGDGGFVYSESADPRLIDEISLGGVIIYPVIKGPGSISAGITKMLDMKICVTKRSINLQHELRNYVWAKNKDGAFTNTPEDHDNHLIDAARYYVLAVLLGKVGKPLRLTDAETAIF